MGNLKQLNTLVAASDEKSRTSHHWSPHRPEFLLCLPIALKKKTMPDVSQLYYLVDMHTVMHQFRLHYK